MSCCLEGPRGLTTLLLLLPSSEASEEPNQGRCLGRKLLGAELGMGEVLALGA